MTKPKDSFYVSIDGGAGLTLDEIWPDGDGPDEPTAADVAAVIRKEGSLSRFLMDWGMSDTIEVHVDHERVDF